MNEVAKFLADLLKRFIKPTPKFFRITRLIGIIALAAGKLPDYARDLGINLDPVSDPWKTVLIVSGIVVAFVSQLTVPDAQSDPTLKVK
jgi:hypothetical protein